MNFQDWACHDRDTSVYLKRSVIAVRSDAMLMLTLKIGESVVCTLRDGQEIEFKLFHNGGRSPAKIGVQAPSDVMILREQRTGQRDRPKEEDHATD
jgi:sRNA-binding carbon storage regulator CsrA